MKQRCFVISSHAALSSNAPLLKMKSSGEICGAPAGVWKRERTWIKPLKPNEDTRRLNVQKQRPKLRPNDLIERKVQKLRCGPAETSHSASGSRVFCVRPPWESCGARCSGQLLRDAAAPNPALFSFFFLSPPPFLSSSLQSRQQGLRTPKVFIQSKPRGDFHQLDERLRLSSHDVSRPLTHQAFIMATPPAQRLPVFSSHLNGF